MPSPPVAVAARLLMLGALTLGLAAPAAAQPASIDVHDPFHERGRFTIKGLSLEGEDHMLVMPAGGRVDATLELHHHCRDCGGAVNQVIVGLAGEPRAQACVWSGGARSGGWTTTRFRLDVPDAPGVYEVRARYAQARSCRDALAWWRTDRARGPERDATIGVIVVDPPSPEARPARLILRELEGATRELEALTAQLDRETRGAMGRRQQRQIHDMAGRAVTLTRQISALHDELRASLDGPTRPGRPVHRPRPRIVRAEPPGPIIPEPMSPDAFRALRGRVDNVIASSGKIEAIRDSVRAGQYFTTRQAIGVLERLTHERYKVEATVLMCPSIVDEAPLPELLGAFTFESYRREVREQTGGVCGWEP